MAIYAASTALVQSAGLLTAPVFTRHFGPARYGVLDVMSSTVALVSTAAVAGLDVAVARSYVAARDRDERQTVVSTGLAVVAGLALAVAAVAVVLARPLAGLLFGDRSHSGLVLAAAATVPLTVVVTFTRGVLRLENRPWMVFGSSLILATFGAGAAVLFAVGLDWGLPGVYTGIALAAAGAVVLNLVATRHLLRRAFSGRHLRAMAAIGLPMVPVALSTWALRMGDRFVLVRFEDLQEIGYYGVGNRLAGVLTIAVLAFSAAWTPMILRLHADDEVRARAVRGEVLVTLVSGMAAAGVAITVFAPDLLRLLAGHRFDRAADVVPPLMLAMVLFATTPVTASALVIAGRTRALAVHAVCAAVVNVVACLVLVPVWGIAGAAWATVLGFGYQAAAYYRSAQAEAPADYRLGPLLAVLGLALPCLAVGYIDAGVVAKMAVVAAFPLILVRARLVDIRHLRTVGRWVR